MLYKCFKKIIANRGEIAFSDLPNILCEAMNSLIYEANVYCRYY
jgi:hypothetical protein